MKYPLPPLPFVAVVTIAACSGSSSSETGSIDTSKATGTWVSFNPDIPVYDALVMAPARDTGDAVMWGCGANLYELTDKGGGKFGVYGDVFKIRKDGAAIWEDNDDTTMVKVFNSSEPDLGTVNMDISGDPQRDEPVTPCSTLIFEKGNNRLTQVQVATADGQATFRFRDGLTAGMALSSGVTGGVTGVSVAEDSTVTVSWKHGRFVGDIEGTFSVKGGSEGMPGHVHAELDLAWVPRARSALGL